MALPPAVAHAQQPIPRWRLADEPRFEVGRDTLGLHRVRGAAILDGGAVAVADAGNYRILLLAATGEPGRSIGRKGSGPGELRTITAMFAFGDTLLIYDSILGRVTTWLANGTLLAAARLPAYHGYDTWLYSIESPTRFILHTVERSEGGESRLYTEATSILLFQPETNEVTALERRAVAYRYFASQPNGSTTYRTPFYGQAQIVALPGGYAFVPLDSALVEIHDLDGRTERVLHLPIPIRAFDRAVIDAERDSSLAFAARNPRFAASVDRIREAYDNMPTRPTAPPVRDAVSMGEWLWVEAFPRLGDATSRWYVIDPHAARILGALDIPRDMKLLGGDDQSVVVLTRGALDVEVVEVYKVHHGGG